MVGKGNHVDMGGRTGKRRGTKEWGSLFDSAVDMELCFAARTQPAPVPQGTKGHPGRAGQREAVLLPTPQDSPTLQTCWNSRNI